MSDKTILYLHSALHCNEYKDAIQLDVHFIVSKVTVSPAKYTAGRLYLEYIHIMDYICIKQ